MPSLRVAAFNLILWTHLLVTWTLTFRVISGVTEGTGDLVSRCISKVKRLGRSQRRTDSVHCECARKWFVGGRPGRHPQEKAGSNETVP